jgi:hypothetical protein
VSLRGGVWLIVATCTVGVPGQDPPPAPPSCEDKAEYTKLDFWVGNWVVTSKGERVGESRIEKIAGGCAVQEHWTSASGGQGTSLNFYNPDTRKWQQHWVSDRGQISEFIGEPKDGGMKLEGYSVLPDGSRVRRRMTLLPVPIGVRQISEYSDDNGKTWKVAFDFLYTEKR